MSSKITVVGTGYVGLVTSVGLAELGNKVNAVDIDKQKVRHLKRGEVPVYETGIKELVLNNVKSGRLQFLSSFEEAVDGADIVFIAVGTPAKSDGTVNLMQVRSVVDSVAMNISSHKLIVIKSTMPVGASKMIEREFEEQTGKDSFDLVYNPDFSTQGTAVYDFFHPDKIILGSSSKKALRKMKEIYHQFYSAGVPFIGCSYETAEMVKFANDTFLATKIAFINQFAELSEAVGSDMGIISKAIGFDARISEKYLNPTPGFGGSCFPIDTRTIIKTGESYDVDLGIMKEVLDANERHKVFAVGKVEKHLGDLNGKTVTVLGLSFKAETDDVRESPAVEILKELSNKGAAIKAHDPKAIENCKAVFNDGVEYCDDKYEALKDSDALILCAEWKEYESLDLEKVRSLMKGTLIVDTRHVFNDKTEGLEHFIYDASGTGVDKNGKSNAEHEATRKMLQVAISV